MRRHHVISYDLGHVVELECPGYHKEIWPLATRTLRIPENSAEPVPDRRNVSTTEEACFLQNISRSSMLRRRREASDLRLSLSARSASCPKARVDCRRWTRRIQDASRIFATASRWPSRRRPGAAQRADCSSASTARARTKLFWLPAGNVASVSRADAHPRIVYAREWSRNFKRRLLARRRRPSRSRRAATKASINSEVQEAEGDEHDRSIASGEGDGRGDPRRVRRSGARDVIEEKRSTAGRAASTITTLQRGATTATASRAARSRSPGALRAPQDDHLSPHRLAARPEDYIPTCRENPQQPLRESADTPEV